MTEIIIADDLDGLSRKAAELSVEIANNVIRSSGRFSVALSGGSTPKSLYRLLASDEFRERIDWENAFFFFGDERNVPSDHRDSNFRMANEALFSSVPIPEQNIHKWNTSLSEPNAVAADYQKQLETHFGGPPCFDLVLLGLGPDCHTASLFPNTSAVSNTRDLVAANWVAKLDAFRFTMTASAINLAANVAFIVSGEEKAEAVARVMNGPQDAENFPAQMICPTDGKLYWFLDRGAANGLSQ